MHVTIGPDQRLHQDGIAANLPDQIRQDREARDHPQRPRRHAREGRQSEGRDKSATSHRATLQCYNITSYINTGLRSRTH